MSQPNNNNIETQTFQAPSIDYERADYYAWTKYLDKLFKWYINNAKDSDGVFGIGWSWDILKKWAAIVPDNAPKRENHYTKTVLGFVKEYLNDRTGEPMFGTYELLEGEKQFSIWNIKERQRWKYEPDTHR